MLATASDLPPELISNVVVYIGTDDNGNDACYGDNRLCLLRSSCVCLFWAERCRRALYKGKIVKITSRKSAQRFLVSVLAERNGVGRHTPLLTLIAHIDVDLELARDSWVHLLATPHVANKLQSLVVSGKQLSHDFPRELLQSPHCGIPPSIPTTPSLTPYSHVSLEYTQFESFRHAVKFLQHFRAAQYIQISTTDWPLWTQPDAVVTSPLPMKRKQPLRRIQARGCTDEARIAVEIAALDSQFAMWKLGSMMRSPLGMPQVILDMYAAVMNAFNSHRSLENDCVLKSADWSLVVRIKTFIAMFTLSVQPRFYQKKGSEQPPFEREQRNGQHAPISVMVKCRALHRAHYIRSTRVSIITRNDLSLFWETVFRGLQPAAVTLAAEGEDAFQAFIVKYRRLLAEETARLRQPGGRAVRFACARLGSEIPEERMSEAVEGWYVVDGATMKVTDEQWDRPEDFDFDA